MMYVVIGFFLMQISYAETVAIQPMATAPITPTPTAPVVAAPATTTQAPATTDRYQSSGSSNNNGSNINQGAGEGKKSQMAGMAQNLLSAGMMVAMAQTIQPEGNPVKYMMYAMAALSAAQGAMLAGDAGQSAATEQASQYNPQSTNFDGGNYDTPSTYTPDTTGEIGVLAGKSKSGAEAMKALTEAGYTLDKNGLTDPSGKTTPTSAFSSAGGLAAAGMSAEDIKKVQKVIDQVSGTSANRVVSMGVDGGGGGGRSPSSDDDAWAKSLSAWSMKNPFLKSKEDQKNLVAGKSVSLHGEPIGVAADNIFHRISKHYTNKRQQKEFID